MLEGEGQNKRLNLGKIGGYENQTFVYRALFEAQESGYGSGVEWIASQTVHRFGGIRDDPALLDAAGRKCQFKTV